VWLVGMIEAWVNPVIGWGGGRGWSLQEGKFGVFIARFMIVMLPGSGNRGEGLEWTKPSIDTGT